MIDIQLASQACLSKVKLGQSLKTVFPQELEKLGSRNDQATVKNTVYGALRYLGYLEFSLDSLVSKRPHGLVNLLLVSIYLIEYSRAANHAVVNAAVSSAKQMGFGKLAGLVNAVLRNYLRHEFEIKQNAENDDVAKLQHQAWWIKKLRQDHPGQVDDIFSSSLQQPSLALRVNTRSISLEKYVRLLDEQNILWRRPKNNIVADVAVILSQPVPVAKIPGFFEGLISVQDVGAQTTAPQLGLRPGQRVLDACAAPGGKTCHILELEDVFVTAIDKDPKRLIKVEENLTRLSLTAKTLAIDMCDIGAWWDGKHYDRILLDVPCSASGVVRRHPDIKWIRREKDIDSFVQQQRSLLSAAWKVLVKGGKLLYTTCSIFPEENEKQVRWFLNEQSDAKIDTGYAAHNGHLILPNDSHDGFFHALLEKK
ncbi:MAG: 16S rRNA (cytosine(967)-C(5))-methyltransferase RsmB [Burkholderiales bacterium]|nr:16S rRNA (cytosine(967)-C(5))-methyltransferase RsmB [Burkholderiales bacterium]OUT78054.1 MAG: 16S rRNA (cytosine(967)-C(5))-methyltransferase [Betaproteobacteria bacterium TMED22]|tara:strand:+ start:4733 stop:6004 length:1272 start_codon:yes stop_codon:yes gene_type:complete